MLSVPLQRLTSLCSGDARVLVIGRLSVTGQDHAVESVTFHYMACLAALNDRLLDEMRPDLVISPLVGDRFDAIDVATRLAECGYAGPYRAISGALPRPALVRKEVRAVAPDVDFDLLIVRHGPELPG